MWAAATALDDIEKLKDSLVKVYKYENFLPWIRRFLSYGHEKSFLGSHDSIPQALYSCFVDVSIWLYDHNLRAVINGELLGFETAENCDIDTASRSHSAELFRWGSKIASIAWLTGNPEDTNMSINAFTIARRLSGLWSPDSVAEHSGIDLDNSGQRHVCSANRGHAHFGWGNWTAAEKWYRDSIATCTEPRDIALVSSFLSEVLLESYSRTGSESQIAESIDLGEKAIKAPQTDKMEKSRRMVVLCRSYTKRGNSARSTIDYQRATDLAIEALALISNDDSKITLISGYCATAWFRKYELTGDMQCLDQGIRIVRDALKSSGKGSEPAGFFSSSNVLAICLAMRFQRLDTEDNLDEAIDLLANAGYSNTLARIFLFKFRFCGQLQYIDLSIKYYGLLDEGEYGTDSSVVRCNFAEALWEKSEETGSESDLTRALEIARPGLAQIASNDIYRPLHSHTLACIMRARFNRKGALDDLNEAIRIFGDIQLLNKHGSTEWDLYTNDLAICLHMKFERTGDVGSLNEAINIAKALLSRTQDSKSNRAEYHLTLADVLRTRFETQAPRNLDDLNAALGHLKAAIDLNPRKWLQSKYLSLNSLVLLTKFKVSGAGEDLTESIEKAKLAVESAAKYRQGPGQAWSYYTLSLALRFRAGQDSNDISDSIKYGRKALEKCPSPHISRPIYANNLSLSLQARYKYTANSRDLEELMENAELCVKLPEGHPNLVDYSETWSSARELQNTTHGIHEMRRTGTASSLLRGIGGNYLSCSH